AGLVARALLAVKGDAYLTAPWPQASYTRADCARWLAGDPGTHSCVAAMLADHAGDFLLQAAAAARLGRLAFGGLFAAGGASAGWGGGGGTGPGGGGGGGGRRRRSARPWPPWPRWPVSPWRSTPR